MGVFRSFLIMFPLTCDLLLFLIGLIVFVDYFIICWFASLINGFLFSFHFSHYILYIIHRFVYERQHINTWLKNHNTSPMTNLVLPNTNVIECVPMRQMIRDWAEKHLVLLT